MNPAEVEAEVREALERSGLRPCRLSLISPLGTRKGIRYAYRVELDGDRIVKARHCGNADDARRFYDLRRQLEAAFAPVLACYGAVLIETWVDGEMVDASEADAWAEAAGALLGRLHAIPLGDDVAAQVETKRWSDAAASDLDLLEGARVLSRTETQTLLRAVTRSDPGLARVALIHKDFCAENMLIDNAGALRIIDTEQPAIEPIGFDLGWTWHRWPMATASWDLFLAGYRSTAPWEPQAQEYWKLITGLTLARVFFQRMPARLESQLERLHRCLARGQDPVE